MILSAQYQFVKSSRKVLLDYCGGISSDLFIAENTTFGRGSIRNLLVHNINTYQWWIVTHALGQKIESTAYESVTSVSEVASHFADVDNLMDEFLLKFDDNAFAPIAASLGNKTFMSTPIELFTHAITHEFHHKGQILSLSRHLGYLPVDTDIIR